MTLVLERTFTRLVQKEISCFNEIYIGLKDNSVNAKTLSFSHFILVGLDLIKTHETTLVKEKGEQIEAILYYLKIAHLTATIITNIKTVNKTNMNLENGQ